MTAAPDEDLPFVVLVYMGEGPAGPCVKAYSTPDQMTARHLAEMAADCGKPAFLVDLWGEGDGDPTIERYTGQFGPLEPSRRLRAVEVKPR